MIGSHALFDPASHYNALRACFVPGEKIRGYFYWRKTQQAKYGEQPGTPLPPLVLRAGSPPTVLEAKVTLPTGPVLGDRFTVGVGLGDGETTAACRAYLVDKGALDRLRKTAAPAMVCCEDDLSLTLRDLATGDVRAVADGVSYPLKAVVLDQDRVAVLTGFGKLMVWNCAHGGVQTIATNEGRACRELAALPEGLIAWTGPDGTEVFILRPGERQKEMLGPFDVPVSALLGLSDGRLVLGHEDGLVQLGERTWHAQSDASILSLAELADGRIAIVTVEGQVYLWVPSECDAEELPNARTTCLVGLPDGRLAVGGPRGLDVWSAKRSICRLSQDRPLRLLPAPGENLVTLLDDNSIWLWNVNNQQGRIVRQCQSDQAIVEPLACGRLRPLLARDDTAAVQLMFDDRALTEVFEVRQVVSALAEMEGTLRQGKGTLEVAIPPESPNLAGQTRVVVVVAESAGK